MTEERRHEEAGAAVTRRGTESDGANEDRGSSGGEERADGRPSGVTGGHASPDQVPSADAVPTVAPEERGETPDTEHAPGADL
ncbi:MAG TPA: hypothetical protein VFO78_11540 [Candidatus Limnocylindrales bacterium]|nr:hypothetical protein [Candidatus Limnocylindrales bacterium]